jgi:integrase
MAAFQVRAEREYAMQPTLTPQQIETLLHVYVRESLDEFEHGLAWHPPVTASDQVDADLEWIDTTRSDLEIRLRTRDTRREVADARTFLAHAGITVAENSDAEMYLRRGLLRADHFILGTMAERMRGNYAADPLLGFAAPSPTPPALAPKRISSVIQEFKEEHLRSNRWEKKTQTDNTAILRDFVEIIGDVPIASISKETLRPYRKTILALPPNRTKNPRYRGLSIVDILKLPDVKPLSVCRINKHFVLVAQLFKWALDKGFVTTNPATGMTLPKEKRDDEARSPFTPDELQRIFFSPEFQATKNRGHDRRPYMYWLPTLGLHTGARIEELAALELDDVKQVGDVWVLDINVKHRRLKNKSSIRQIALHPTVLDLGFLDYVEQRRKQKHTYLFPELGIRQGRKGMTASNHFARYLDRLDIVAKDKVFHSFRHTLLNRCKQQGIDLSVASEIAGHSNESMTYGLYGKKLEPAVQLQYLSQIDFQIDLGPLKDVWRKLMPAGRKS